VFLHKLLEGLSGYDGVAAFRVARACGLAPLDQAAAFVREGFQQPPFTLFALEEMRRDRNDRGAWVSLAIEAALAFSAANEILRQTNIPRNLEDDPALIKRRSWTQYFGNNLLGWLFDQAYYNSWASEKRVISALRKLPSPTRFVYLVTLGDVVKNIYRRLRPTLLVYTVSAIVLAVMTAPVFKTLIANLPQKEDANQILAYEWIRQIYAAIAKITNNSSHESVLALAILFALSSSALQILYMLSHEIVTQIKFIFSGSKLTLAPRPDDGVQPIRLFNRVNPYRKLEHATLALYREINNVRWNIASEVPSEEGNPRAVHERHRMAR
jgi:hypothetical protein